MTRPGMDKIGCGWNGEAIVEYGAGKLDAQTRTSVERHIESCAACREAAAGQAQVWTALDAWEAPPVSPDFDRRLYARMSANVTWRERALRFLRPALLRRGVPLVAATGLIAVAVVVIEYPHRTTPVPAQAVRQVEPLRPDQVESALQDMQTLQEFNGMIRPETGESQM